MRCPVCKSLIARDSERKWLPFCSRRCQLIDLGDWLSEKHRLPSEEAPDELSDLPDNGDEKDPTH